MQRVLMLYLPIAVLLSGCGDPYPLQTEPFLNGQLEARLKTCSIGEPCTTQLVTFNVHVTGVKPDAYTFNGTVESDLGELTLEGTETPLSYNDIAYVSPQARGLFGSIEGTLQAPSGGIYTLSGTVLYGWGGGPSPGRLPPSGVIFASPSPACEDAACSYREIRLSLPEQPESSA